MNDSTHVTPRPWRAGPRPARTAAAIIATAFLALLAAACGGGSPSSTGHGGSSNAGRSPSAGGSPNSPLLAFSHCMRSHGVPNFPDPQPGASNAKFPGAQQLGVGSSQLRAAENACWHVLPPGTDDQFPPAEVPLLLRGMLPFARCMRSHGVPNFPDPAVDSEGRPIFPLSTHGISLNYSHSRQFTTKMDDCQHMLPHQLGGIPFG
jgi:hypothetical protein